MKTLLLLRHAKAESPAATAKRGQAGDKDRRLDPRGQEDCVKIGAYLSTQDYTPDLIAASTAARTMETMECIASRFAATTTTSLDDFYLASSITLLRHIHTLDDSLACTMIIGHNPGMHELACSLAAQTLPTDLMTDLKNHFPTCALAVINFDQPSWGLCDAGDGALVDFIYPKML